MVDVRPELLEDEWSVPTFSGTGESRKNAGENVISFDILSVCARQFRHQLLLVSSTAFRFIHLQISSFWFLHCSYGKRAKSSNNLGGLMWKITTRGFTLQEVLIMAAMNIAARTDSDRQRERTIWRSPAHGNSLNLGDCHGKSD